jgi:type IV pilus assembly protein PilO
MGGFAKLKWYVQVLVVAGVCGGLLGGVWYWFLAPVQAEIDVQTKKLADLQANVDKSLRQKAVFEQFKKEAEVLQARLEQLKMVLPQDRETDQILKQVQSSASGSGLQIKSGVSRPPVDHEVYTEYPLDMEVIGTYHSLGDFLEKIRRLDRIVNIDRLKIESRATEGSSTAFTASVGANYQAKTYVYRDEVVDKAPAAKAVKVKK